MATEVRLPQEGMAMTKGSIVEWFKAPGDTVVKGEVIAEAEADKANFEIAAPASGILASILVAEGEEVPVRAVLAMILDLAETTDAPAPTRPSPLQVVPAARRLAKEHGLDLETIQGTGPGGRITEQDVQAALAGPGSAGPSPAAVGAEVIPLRGVRGKVADRMRASLQSMAQLTLTTEADVTALVRQREEAKDALDVTYTHLLARATALALRQHPRLNAVVEDNEIRVQPEIHIGIAVPLPDGLIVPVVRNADRMTLAELADAVRAIVAQVHERRATPDLVMGSTFTLTNLGSFGIDAFTPIVNPPEVAILGAGRITDRSVPARGEVAWTKVMTLSLTIDHRAVDGVPGAQFLQTLAELLRQPEVLFA